MADRYIRIPFRRSPQGASGSNDKLCVFICSIIAMNHNKPPLTFKRFKAIVQQLGLPKSPQATVSRQQMETCSPPLLATHDQQYGVLSLDELGEPR